MHHFYDKCPYTLSDKEARLKAARTLSQAGIPCLIHGEDALAFIHFVPTGLFALHVVVPDQDVQRAKSEILGAHPYRLFTGIDKTFNEPLYSDPNQTRAFPNSIFLECSASGTMDPYMIIIHPEKEFNIVVGDHSRSLSLPPFPDDIRFPTKAAFLDSTIEVRLDPNSGHISSRVTTRFATWISYVIQYCVRTFPYVLPNGNLVPEAEALKRSLKPENQPQFDAFFRGSAKALDRDHNLLVRREVLRSLGKIELANRPFPRLSPGNPQLRNQLMQKKEDKKKKQNAQPKGALEPIDSEHSTSPSRYTQHPSSQSTRSFSTSAFALRGASSFIKLARNAIP